MRSDKAKVKELGDHKSCRKIVSRAGMWELDRTCKKLRKNLVPKNSHYGSAGINVSTKLLQNNLWKLACREKDVMFVLTDVSKLCFRW